jgi:DNA sulfur modification protein DndD
MKLHSLQLHNFRQFYGTTPEIVFAGDESKNVTVIHGVNGAGKTAILNAFTWLLYEKFSQGFKEPENLLNKRALREAKAGSAVNCWGELKFEHDGYRYELKRRFVAKVDAAGKYTVTEKDFELQFCGLDGAWTKAKDVPETIGRILPDDLHSYFFFDGERIEKLIEPGKAERRDLAKATKTLLGIEILERAQRHLSTSIKELEDEFGMKGSIDAQEMVANKNTKEAEVLGASEEIKRLEEEVANLERVKSEIENKLRQETETREDQKRRDQLAEDERLRNIAIDRNESQLGALLSSKAYSVLLGAPIADFIALIERLRQQGELPSGIKRQFVDDLLNKLKICICGQSLADDAAEARAAVSLWLKKAGLGDVEEKALRMRGEVNTLLELSNSFWSRIYEIDERNLTDQTELEAILKEKKQLDDKFLSHNSVDIVALEQRKKEREQQIIDAKAEIKERTGFIENTELVIQGLKKSIEHAQTSNAQQQKIQQRLSVAKDAAERLAQVQHRFEEHFRSSLARRIRTLFHAISVTPYTPVLKDDYSIDLMESAGGPEATVAFSQGESLVASFSFIGAMIEEARAYHARKEKWPGPDSSKFPLVMDSPFGALDPTNRRSIAEHISRLADQVVVLVTKTQWRDEVETALSGRIGRAYALSYFTPKEGVEPDTLAYGSKSVRLVDRSPNQFEFTEITEIVHD